MKRIAILGAAGGAALGLLTGLLGVCYATTREPAERVLEPVGWLFVVLGVIVVLLSLILATLADILGRSEPPVRIDPTVRYPTLRDDDPIS